MWKLITAAVNRLVQQAWDEANTAPRPAVAPQPVAGAPAAFSREVLEQQFQRAVQLLQGGNTKMALEMMKSLTEQAAAAQPNGPLYAEARFKQATILSAADELPLAETACRAAIVVPATTEAAKKDRLNYLSYLGGILAGQGKHEEAEKVLRDGAEQRRELYGAEHPQYAAGLASLAEVLLARDHAGEALEVIDEAVRIESRARHERWPIDLALRAYILKSAQSTGTPAFTAFDELTRGMQKTLANQCVRMATQSGAPLAQAVLSELRQRLQALAATDGPLVLNVDIALVSAAQINGDHPGRIAACRDMVALCQTLPSGKELALAQQALAMALDDAGQSDEVPAIFDLASQKARETGDLTLMATVLRNYAQWADRTGRTEQADALYQEAVDCGASSGDWSTHGRCTVAYGTFLRRVGRLDEARGLLEEAVAHLAPTHPDYATAEEQLRLLGGSNSDE